MFLSLFLVIGYLFEVNDFGTDVLCDLLDLKLPEVGQFNLDGSPSDCHDPVHRLLYPFADLHPLPDIDLHLYRTSPSWLVKQNICYTNWFTVYCINHY